MLNIRPCGVSMNAMASTRSRRTDETRCRLAASTVPRQRGRRRRSGRDQPPGPGQPARRHPACLPPRQDASQLRLPHEPGADPQPSPVGREPRIPPHRRSRQRSCPQGRVGAGESKGIRALNPAMGFPMEMDRFPGGKIWVVSHKPVAVAAGLGQMGIHRNIIHPKFGNFILLGTVLIAAEATAYDQPISYNPCLECKLCVAACPVGAICPERRLQFLSLLHAQLPGVHGRLHQLGRTDSREQERPGLPQEGG